MAFTYNPNLMVIGGKPAQQGPATPQAQGFNDPHPEFKTPIPNDYWGPAKAFANQGQAAIDSYASTIQKAVTPYTYPIASKIPGIGQYARNPATVQQGFEQNMQQVAQDPNVRKHPVAAGLGGMAGEIAMNAPAAIGASLMSPAAILPQVAGQAPANFLMGGLKNEVGAGNGTFNAKNAVKQTLMGIPANAAGLVAGNLLGNLGGKVSSLLGSRSSAAKAAVEGMKQADSGLIPDSSLNDFISNAALSSGKTVAKDGLIQKGMNSLLPKLETTTVGAIVGHLSGYGASIGGVAGAALAYSPKVLKTLFTNPTARRIFSSAGSLSDDLFKNPTLSQYYVNTISNTLSNAGIKVATDSTGQMNVTHESEKPVFRYNPKLMVISGQEGTAPQGSPQTPSQNAPQGPAEAPGQAQPTPRLQLNAPDIQGLESIYGLSKEDLGKERTKQGQLKLYN